LKIVEARVIVTCPGRNFVTLKVVTEDGLHGLGDATLNGRELAVAAYLTEHVAPLLIGRDARRVEDTWHYLYKGAYWRRGPVTMTAIAAVDMALWDILGKSLNTPVYRLLGGASRDAVLVYGHANGTTVESALEAVHDYVKQGYKAVRVQAAVPGLDATYGVGKGKGHYEPAEKGLPPTGKWNTSAYLAFTPQLFVRVRKEFGPDLPLLHDVHHRLTPIEAARLGKELEPHHLFWMEDPVPAELQEGFTHLRKIAALAEMFHVRTGCHGATDLSPVCLAAALHFDLAVHNFGIQEYMKHSEETDKVFPHAYRFADGMLHPGEAPGLGVDIDEKLAAQHPYDRAYLPTSRLLDGTVHSW
jgi:mannonate dehydratase